MNDHILDALVSIILRLEEGTTPIDIHHLRGWFPMRAAEQDEPKICIESVHLDLVRSNTTVISYHIINPSQSQSKGELRAGWRS